MDRHNGQGQSSSFLMRLFRDTRGNTLVLMAAALLPLLALTGGAVEVGRYYITKSQLQNACDAAVLAGRKSMTGVTWTTADETIARNFFNTNFPSGSLGSINSSIAFVTDSAGVVNGTATATSPATLMQLFGAGDKVLTATCRAELQLPNADVMFVLDTTLSMLETNPGDTQDRITGLRAAVQNFYTQLEAAKAAGTQVRYGFVPYSSTVNVGLLLKREWMADSWKYQSRQGNRVVEVGGTAQGPESSSTDNPAWVPAATNTTSYIQSENCTAPANTVVNNNDSWSAWSPSSTALPRTRTQVQRKNGSTFAATRMTSGTYIGQCRIVETIYANSSRTVTQTVVANPNAGQVGGATYQYYWDYLQRTINVSGLKGSLSSGLMAGGTISVDNFKTNTTTHMFETNSNISWGTGTSPKACIEERQTIREGEIGTAYDLDVDLVPNPAMPETLWGPAIPALVYARSVGNYYPANNAAITGWSYADVLNTQAGYITPSSFPTDFAACPTVAKKLSTITSTALTTYLSSLVPAGRTYHDIGFLWGLRLISAQGLFASENQVASNGGSIARHIIFMTDGATETNIADYDAYGLAALDRRRKGDASTIPTDAQQDSIVESRLTQLCDVAKAKGITVWVIAFGTDLTSLLSGCATSTGHAFRADDTAELNEAFSNIASQIAQLRLTQ